MPAEIRMPVVVRVGETEEQWGEIIFDASDGVIDAAAIRRQTASFFRAAADALENPSETDEEVDDAAPE